MRMRRLSAALGLLAAVVFLAGTFAGCSSSGGSDIDAQIEDISARLDDFGTRIADLESAGEVGSGSDSTPG